MEMLKENVQVKVMLRLLEENGQKEVSTEAASLIAVIDAMSQQHDTFMSELRNAQRQILMASEQHYPLSSFCIEMTAVVNQWAGELHFALAKTQEGILSGVRTSVARFNGMYIPPWDKTESALCAHELMKAMQEKTAAQRKEIAEWVQKIEAMAQTPPSIDGHLQSIMGLAFEMDDVYTGRFRDALASLRSAHSTLNHIDQKIGEALEIVRRLPALAEQKQAKLEKTSIRRRLIQTVNCSAPSSPQKHHDAER